MSYHYDSGVSAALLKLGMAPFAPAVSLTRRPPSLQPQSFMKSKPATGVSPPLPAKKEYGGPANASGQAADKND